VCASAVQTVALVSLLGPPFGPVPLKRGMRLYCAAVLVARPVATELIPCYSYHMRSCFLSLSNHVQ